MFTPDSTIYLLSVPLSMGDRKQISFTSAAEQSSYFYSLRKHNFDNYNYVRQDKAIVVNANVETLLDCNYMMYKNANFRDKWFYAYITRKEWVSQNSCRLYLKTDVFQTWQFKWTLHPSMVIREHTPTDYLYEHTLPEDIGYGGHKATRNRLVGETAAFSMAGNSQQLFSQNYYAVFIMSEQARYASESTLPAVSYMGGSANACYCYAMPIGSVRQFVTLVNENGQASAIVTAVCVPKGAVVFHEITSTIPGLGYVTGIEGNVSWEWQVDKTRDNIDGYTPKNKKLYCYPYNFDMIYTGNQQQVLRYEWFNNPTIEYYKLRLFFMLSAMPIYGCMPEAYDGKSLNEQAGLQLQNFPQMSWTSDFFANYMGLHGYSLAANTVIEGIHNITPYAGQLYGAGALTEQGVTLGANILDMKNVPRTEKGAIDGNYAVHTNTNHIYICTMQIRAEYAEIVDNYFTMYGYKVMTMKTPQFRSRKRFNYLQTQSIDITGDIPQEDLVELQDLFNGGLTVWKYFSGFNFGSYAGDNTPG